jgi:hypothetical protein
MALELSLPFYIFDVFSCTNRAFQSVPKAKLQGNSKTKKFGEENVLVHRDKRNRIFLYK